jgi:hypothetical protein
MAHSFSTDQFMISHLIMSNSKPLDDDDCGSLGFAPDTMDFNPPPENTYSASRSNAPDDMMGKIMSDNDADSEAEAPSTTGTGMKGEGLSSSLETNEDKKTRRIMANRRSAKESRERRKHLLSKLQATVDVLTAENRSLNSENGQLRDQIQDLKHQLMMSNAMSGGGGRGSSSMSMHPSNAGMNHSITTNTAPGGVAVSNPNNNYDQQHLMQHQQQMMQQLQHRQQQLLLSSGGVGGGNQRSSGGGLSSQHGDYSHNPHNLQQQHQQGGLPPLNQQQDYFLAAALQRARDQHPF